MGILTKRDENGEIVWQLNEDTGELYVREEFQKKIRKEKEDSGKEETN